MRNILSIFTQRVPHFLNFLSINTTAEIIKASSVCFINLIITYLLIILLRAFKLRMQIFNLIVCR